MDIRQDSVDIFTEGQGLYDFTDQVQNFVAQSGMECGALTLFCQHTSCSLIIQENADPDVCTDLTAFFAKLVPQNMDWVSHVMEGPDDMPAHIKAALNATCLHIPVDGGTTMLGIWQGVYLFEHRDRPHRRRIILQMVGK